MHGTENDNGAVNIVKSCIVCHIFVSARKNLCGHITVQSLVCGNLKGFRVTFRLVIQFYGFDFYRRIAVPELIYAKADAVRCYRVKTAKTLGLNFFTLVNRYPFAADQCLQSEILRLISHFFNNGGVKGLLTVQFNFHITVVDVRLCVRRHAVGILRRPAFAVVLQQILRVCFFALFQTLINDLRAAHQIFRLQSYGRKILTRAACAYAGKCRGADYKRGDHNTGNHCFNRLFRRLHNRNHKRGGKCRSEVAYVRQQAAESLGKSGSGKALINAKQEHGRVKKCYNA